MVVSILPIIENSVFAKKKKGRFKESYIITWVYVEVFKFEQLGQTKNNLQSGALKEDCK